MKIGKVENVVNKKNRFNTSLNISKRDIEVMEVMSFAYEALDICTAGLLRKLSSVSSLNQTICLYSKHPP